jgi:hypothetical protein
MDIFRKTSSGDPMNGDPAEWRNLLVEVAQDYLRRQKVGQQTVEVAPEVTLRVRNESGGSLAQYSIVALSTKLVAPEGADATFYGRAVFESATPTAGSAFAIMQRPTADESIGLARISGDSFCKIDVVDAGHGFADAITADYAKLRSQAAAGPAQILWKESGTGTKWAFVRFNAAGFGTIASINDQTGTDANIGIGYGGTNVSIGTTIDAWSASVAYDIGWLVTSGGNTYRCILAHTNQVPPNATYWVQVTGELNLSLLVPSASASARGLVTKRNQVIGESSSYVKYFNSQIASGAFRFVGSNPVSTETAQNTVEEWTQDAIFATGATYGVGVRLTPTSDGLAFGKLWFTNALFAGWSNSTLYAVVNIVSANDGTGIYRCIQANTGSLLTDAAFWTRYEYSSGGFTRTWQSLSVDGFMFPIKGFFAYAADPATIAPTAGTPVYRGAWATVNGLTFYAGLYISGSLTGATLADGDYGDVTASSSGTVITIDNDAVTYAKMQDVSATDRLLGRDTAGAGNVEEISVTGGIEFTGSTSIQVSAFTGDVTKTAGGTALTIANDAVTYAKMQNVSAASRLLGRGSAGGAGDPEEITLSGLSMVGTVLTVTAGSGDVVGPASSTDNAVALWDGTTGELLQDSDLIYDVAGETLRGTNQLFLVGANVSGGNLQIDSTTHATKGLISLAYTGGHVIIGGAATASELRFMEPSGSGTNYSAFKAQAQGATITYTLPAADAAGQLTSDGAGALTWGAAPLVILRDEKAQNTAGGTFTSGADQTRVLKVEHSDASGICSLSGNQFTLSAGTYEITVRAPAVTVNYHYLILYNVTDTAVIETGNASFARPDPNGDSSDAWLFHKFTIGASKALEIRHRCTTTAATFGFGLAGNHATEVYTEVVLRKVG